MSAKSKLHKEKQLFYAIADLGRVANSNSPMHNLGYYKVISKATGEGAEEDALLTFTGKNLLMSDAMGIRLYGEALSAEDIKNTISAVVPKPEEAAPELPAEPEPVPEPEEAVNPHVLEKQPDEWNLMLVNQWNPIDRNYEIDLIELNNGHSVDRRAYPDLQDMMDDARAEGLKPILCSSYRSNQKQRDLFANQVNKYLAYGMTEEEAEAEAAKWVAIPGTSEHHTGLAVDIVALDYQLLDDGQQNTPEQQWLRENSYKYGYILRYPPDKSDLTGINFETWHYRYVGKEAAAEIYEKGICLEEYLADYMN